MATRSIKKIIKLPLFVVPTLLVYHSTLSCTHDPVVLAMVDTVCFQADVLPLLQTSCGISGCHDNQTAKAGFIATNYASVLQKVVPGNARESELYKVLVSVNSPNLMPPNDPLNLQQRTLIRLWIEQGALNTGCNPVENPSDTLVMACTNDTVSFQNDVWPIVNRNCVGCHNPDDESGGLTFHSYTHFRDVALSMQDGVSWIVGVISWADGFEMMPRNADQLDSCSIATIDKWIAQGALNN
jgi:hypothetical protein